MTVLSLRALNRATLARQMLLRRQRVSPREAIARLVGLQAQLMRPTVLALAARLDGFRSDALAELIQQRALVRAPMMRATLHLMTAGDYLAFRPVLQPVLTKSVRRAAVPDLASARKFFAKPRTFNDFREALVAKMPDADIRALAYAVRMQLPLVEVGEGAEFTLAEEWIGERLGVETTPHALALRYVAAFGPATAADFQNWSGLPSMRAVFEELRPRLVTFRDEARRELFDLPDAPRPSEEVEAPVRFLPEFDILLLGHAVRTRIIADEHRPKVTSNLRVLPVFTIDGFAAGTWRMEKGRVEIEPFRKLTKKEREAVDAEATKIPA